MALFFVLIFIFFVFTGIYIYRRSGKMILFYGGNALSKRNRLLRGAAAVVLSLLCCNMRSTSAIILLHLLAVFLITDVIAVIGRILFGKQRDKKVYRILHRIYGCGFLPVVLVICILAFGYYNMGQISRTTYTVSSEKLSKDYRIILLTDIHYDTIQSPQLLQDKINEINDLNPDLILLGGDIVEEGTSKEAMREAFHVLGSIKSTYGTYYVYGNHDRQPYSDSKTYTDKELESAIAENGIRILKDSCVEIENDLVLAGRDDAAWGQTSGRASSEELLKDADREKYIILMDHQPIEAEENGRQGVDLEVSGHTHGGQIWPVGLLTGATGSLNYGEYQRDNCKVIVSSGVAGWGYPLRTEEHCEYVMIDLIKEK